MAPDFHATAVAAVAADALSVGDVRKATALYRSILEQSRPIAGGECGDEPPHGESRAGV
jgi:hypothetical protein